MSQNSSSSNQTNIPKIQIHHTHHRFSVFGVGVSHMLKLDWMADAHGGRIILNCGQPSSDDTTRPRRRRRRADGCFLVEMRSLGTVPIKFSPNRRPLWISLCLYVFVFVFVWCVSECAVYSLWSPPAVWCTLLSSYMTFTCTHLRKHQRQPNQTHVRTYGFSSRYVMIMAIYAQISFVFHLYIF